MPTYMYRREDGTTFEIRQKFSDDPLDVDPKTGQKVQRVIQASGIIFKGSGFYVTDNNGASRKATTPLRIQPAIMVAATVLAKVHQTVHPQKQKPLLQKVQTQPTRFRLHPTNNDTPAKRAFCFPYLMITSRYLYILPKN